VEDDLLFMRLLGYSQFTNRFTMQGHEASMMLSLK